MVTQKEITDLDFTTIEEYFQYILDSITVGQRKQAKDLYHQLGGEQKMAFFAYLAETNSAESQLNYVLKILQD